MNEHVALPAEVVLAVRAPISSEMAHAFARRASHRLWRVLEWARAGVAHLARIRHVVQRRARCIISVLVLTLVQPWDTLLTQLGTS